MFTLFYLLKANIALIALYALYRTFFKNDTFFTGKRFLLLVICLLPIVIPSIHFPVTDGIFVAGNSTNTLQKLKESTFDILLPEYTVLPGTSRSQELVNTEIFKIVYLSVVSLLLLKIVFQWVAIFCIKKRSLRKIICGRIVFVCKQECSPFSFFRWIIIDSERVKEDGIEEILVHESTHVRELHSIDVILSDIFHAVFWYNPVAWLVKKEIRLNLEFIADRSVLKNTGDTEHYQFHLLRLSYNKAIATLSNNFNVSPLKKRIKMMNKKKSANWGLSKYLLLFPFVTALLLLNNDKMVSETVAKQNMLPVTKTIAEGVRLEPKTSVQEIDSIDKSKLVKKKIKRKNQLSEIVVTGYGEAK